MSFYIMQRFFYFIVILYNEYSFEMKHLDLHLMILKFVKLTYYNVIKIEYILFQYIRVLNT